jgi:hypothetical protein
LPRETGGAESGTFPADRRRIGGVFPEKPGRGSKPKFNSIPAAWGLYFVQSGLI